MREPREMVEEVEQHAELPQGAEERFSGYGVIGLTFASQHILCLRRWPISSLGQSYTSVWHRDPSGQWTFIQDVLPHRACTRYFGSSVERVLLEEINIVWSGPRQFSVTGNGEYDFHWQVSLTHTIGTRFMNAGGPVIPNALWRNPGFLKFLGTAGSLAMKTGRLSLTGQVPNGQTFMSNPRYVWAVGSSEATVGGEDLGAVGPLPVQARLGDIWIPQEGRFFIGNAFLEVFDPMRHLSTVSREKIDKFEFFHQKSPGCSSPEANGIASGTPAISHVKS